LAQVTVYYMLLNRNNRNKQRVAQNKVHYFDDNPIRTSRETQTERERERDRDRERERIVGWIGVESVRYMHRY
jgi:hypothetical protein